MLPVGHFKKKQRLLFVAPWLLAQGNWKGIEEYINVGTAVGFSLFRRFLDSSGTIADN